MKINVPQKLHVSTRHYLQNRQWAIRDVFDALVELITNADDSYNRLYRRQLIPKDGGRILIETCASIKNTPLLIVRDRAEGMTSEDMEKKLLTVGDRNSESGNRGFMGRGAKDCSELGTATFESIVNDKYYKSQITGEADFIVLKKGDSVNHDLRKSLHIERGNGTVITIECTRHRLPRPSTICEDLPLHFALRDIMSEHSDDEVLFRDLNSKEKQPKKLIYYQPQAQLVHDKEFDVQGYPNAKAKLIIFKSPQPLEDKSPKFRKSGLIVKGKRAIHECSLLHPSFENDTYGRKYFGRIECEYIDFLLDEYDQRSERRESPTVENPRMVVDPNRQHGLERTHPFVKALLDYPTRVLKEFIDKDHAANEKLKEEIANEDLKKRLNKLARIGAKYLSDNMQELEPVEIFPPEREYPEAFAKRGIFIYPTYANIGVENIRTFGIYVNRDILDKEGAEVSLKSGSGAIEFINSLVKLMPHRTKRDTLYCSFSVKGLEPKEGICIEAECEDLLKAEARINVVEKITEQHEFGISSLEFEHEHYKLKEGSTKTIILFARYPELVNTDTEVKVNSSDNISLPVRGRCVLTPVQGSNFASAEIKIEARRLCQENITLSAKLGNAEAFTKIKVVQKEEVGPPMDIKIKDEDFGHYRAQWADYEGKPYLLLISARHPSLRRYLGPSPDFKGQDGIHFRAILAEIVAESICRKLLLEQSQKQSHLFQWSKLNDNKLIAVEVLTDLQKRMKEFLPEAHRVMIEDSEIRQMDLAK